MAHSFFDVELDVILESSFNPRKTFDAAGLAALTASIKAQGVLQPILLRPADLRNGYQYEIVAGARRFRAAKAAGLQTIPATVRQLDDREAIEIALLENILREDLSPLEEGRSFQVLHEAHGFPVVELAAKAGKSVSYVYQRMQLAKLPPKVQALMDSGKLTVAVALQVARIPDPKRATECAVALAARADGATVAVAKRHVEQFYMLDLKLAPFDTRAGAGELLEFVGPCTTCPKRTGNQRDLWGESSGPDLCTDKACWDNKTEAAWMQAAAKAKAQGVEVVAAGHNVAIDYQDPAAVCYDDPERRTYEKLLGGKRGLQKLEERVLVRNPSTGAAELRLPKVSLRKLLRDAGHDFWAAKKKPSAKESAALAEIREQERLDQTVFRAVWARGIAELRARKDLDHAHLLRAVIQRTIRDQALGQDVLLRWSTSADQFGDALIAQLPEQELHQSFALLVDMTFLNPLREEVEELFGADTVKVWDAEERAKLEGAAAAAAVAAEQPKAKGKKRQARAGAK